MKPYYILSLLLALFFSSCRIPLVNMTLQKLGIFEDEVKLIKLKKDNNEIAFIPIHHAGTREFYNDVTKKIDSLEAIGYFMYWEKIKSKKMDSTKADTVSRKLRKITGIYTFGNDFVSVLDTLTKNKLHKLKKQLINQPSYWDLGIDSLNSKNADATVEQILEFHDEKYGKVVLEPCDFETKITEKSSCQNLENHKDISDDIIINFRNQIVLEELDKEIKNKIAIVYGRGHLEGIKKGLIERGYIQVAPLPD
ncbi:hypothetical protein ACFQO1_06190 [Jejudonia soesokkakensis]|uniref:TraB/GumN family protein n=1 Tax=Jejudonia soesokkakensis TaxID=1323432 RepID=A0ABW2MUC3_9FLAO